MTEQRPQRREWFVSSYTGEQGNCVEVWLDSTVRVRDTKDRQGGEITMSASAWRGLLAHLVATMPLDSD
ncbi:DUF397 domain-containing protein [Amycolatopsis sp. cmx-4-54]|uniref:DUF397 domain-containing protein n=1 Tax=Amycolatopsis sp. cmx-4-54 TaxID=2790936 RepID=UPI003979E90B